VITNTASAQWTHDGQPGQALSNRVDVTVTPRPPERPTITTYRLTSGGGDKSVPLAPTQCAARRAAALSSNATSTIPLSGVYEGISTAPASLQSTEQFPRRRSSRRRGHARIGQCRSAARDTLSVVLELENGDSEQMC
jgi:hypothetical protein